MPAPSHAAEDRGTDQKRQGFHFHLHKSDIDERLGDGRYRVAHIECAGDLLIGDGPPQAVERGGGGVRSDTQRVEEVGDQTDDIMETVRGSPPLALDQACNPDGAEEYSDTP